MAAPVHCTHEVSADPAATWQAMTSEAWPAALDAQLHDGSALLERTELPDGGLRLVSRRQLPDGVPSFLRRFVPADGTVTQTDVWEPASEASPGERSGTWSVALPGSPGSIGGTMAVRGSGEGARWSVDGAVVVKVPLVGGRAEAFLAPLVEKLVAKQADVLRSLLG